VFPLKDNIPTDRTPLVTMVLIVANVLMYFLFQEGTILGGPDEANVVDYGAIPYEFTHPGDECGIAETGAGEATIACEGQAGVTGSPDEQPSTYLTAFSSMFMHGSIVHLGGNMLFLWIFGNNVEDAMSRVRYIAFYVLGGLAALAGQILVGTDSDIPTIGASGAVAAVLGGYLLMYPRARVTTLVFIIFFVTIIQLPAIFFLGIWFLQQVLFGSADLTNPTGGGGGVAYFAHIGGFVFGLLLIRAFAQRQKDVEPRFPVY
jgi:membrane associated rhomboid family serine protease